MNKLFIFGIFLLFIPFVKADCFGVEDYNNDGRINRLDYIRHQHYLLNSCGILGGEGGNTRHFEINKPSSPPFIVENDGSRTYIINNYIVFYEPAKLIIKWKPSTYGLYYFSHNNISYELRFITRHGINIKVVE